MDTIKHVNIQRNFIAVDYNDSDTMGAFYTHIDIPTFDAIMDMIEENNEKEHFYSVSFLASEDTIGKQRHTLFKIQIIGIDIVRETTLPVKFDPLSDEAPIKLPKSSHGYCERFTVLRDDGQVTCYKVLE